jgi:hypothetical protein
MCGRRRHGKFFLCAVVFGIAISGCGGGTAPVQPAVSTAVTLPAAIPASVRAVDATTPKRLGFLGAFFRPQGSPPYGVFTPNSSQIAPVPYPTPGSVLVGNSGYCDESAANGASIDGSYQVDTTKLNDLIYLGARWARMPASQFFIDLSHIFGPGQYAFGTLDAAQCIAYVYHFIKPVIELDAGPVQYNAVPGTFSPVTVPTYESAADYGQWCGVVAAHEKAVFPGVTEYSLPGNEVNANPQLFPGGNAQIAAYAKTCYAAIKAANPSAFVYGFELSMDGSLDAPAFVSNMVALGCKVGTCYDGLAIHLSLRYPMPAAGTPCYPNPGGDYTMQCVNDIITAAQAPVHVLISEAVYPVPAYVPDEPTQAEAVSAAFSAYASDPSIDGALYADVDECALYPTGFFSGGCLIDTSGNQLPAYGWLQWLASQSFD